MRNPNDFGPPPPPPPPPLSGFMVFLNITNAMTHLLLGAIAACAFLFSIARSSGILSLPLPIPIPVLEDDGHLRNHIYLCVVGYILMMAQGVLTFSSHAGWSVSLRYEDKRLVHLVMQIVGALLALIGSFMRISGTENNFQSAHGILGLVAMIMTVISLAGGVANLFMRATVFTKVAHSCVGSLTILFAFICLCLGFDMPIYRVTMGNDITNFAITITVFGLIGVLLSATISNIKRIMDR